MAIPSEYANNRDKQFPADYSNASDVLLEHNTKTVGEGDALDTDDVETERVGRETWGKKIDFLLSVIGFAVDLANVWRFPYLCYKNGGGAFLVPYCIMLIIGGIPLFYMELAIGQYHGKGAVSSWGAICPIAKGIGWAVILIAFYTDFFYNVIISWAVYYFFASMNKEVPWIRCGEWSTSACFDGHMRGEKFPVCIQKDRIPICTEYKKFNSTNCDFLSQNCSTFTFPTVSRSEAIISLLNVTELFHPNSTMYDNKTDSIHLNELYMGDFCNWRPESTSPAAEYFQRKVLGIHEAIGIEYLGPLRWENSLCLLAVYLICYFSLWKGIKTSGKVVWFTALFPYVVLIVSLVRGVTLPGAREGILEYITPRFDKILEAQVWVDAATQVFFSLGPGFGVLLAFSSYNKFNNNVYRDALATSLINCLTSFLAGFVVFSILGYLSHKTCKDFYTVAQEGPGLVFEVYPEAIATLPGNSFWSIIFFLMLLTLGLDSSFGGSEAIITGITDEFPVLKKRREIFVAVLFTVYFLVGLASCTYGGFYVVRIFEVFAAGYSILFAVFCECIVVSWVYGVWRFAADVKEMIGHAPGLFWIACWCIIAPVFLGTIMVYGMSQYEPLKVQDYDFPFWANVFGWTMAGSSMACIPVFALALAIKGNCPDLCNGWWSMSGGCFSPVRQDYTECQLVMPDISKSQENGGKLHLHQLATTDQTTEETRLDT